MGAEVIHRDNLIVKIKENPYGNENNLNQKVKESPEIKEQLSKSKKERFGISLDLVGNSIKGEDRILAFNLAKETLKLGNKKPLKTNEFKTKLADYQEDHHISIGKVGPETYAEMKAEAIIEKAGKGFEKAGLSVNTINEINTIIPKLGRFSENKFILNTYLAKFRTEEKFKGIREKPEFKKVLNESKVVANSETTKLENSKEGKSFVSIIKDDKIPWNEKIKKIASDPTTLMVGGLLFLFGVIGGNSKYTNSFMKRFGILIGGALFGKSLWNKIGIGELIDDVSDSATKPGGALKEAGNTIANSASTAKKATTDFFKNEVPTSWKKFKDFDYNGFETSISGSINSLTDGFSSYNKTFEKDGKKLDGYIKKDKLEVFSGLLNEQKFLNLSKEDALKIDNKSSLNMYISDDLKKKITDSKINDKDVKTFISKHLKHSFEENKDAKLVKNLIFTNTIKDKFNKTFNIDNVEYIKNNEKLNEEISTDLSGLINSLDPDINNLGTTLALSIKSGEIDDFKKEDFAFLKTDTITSNTVNGIIEKVKNYNEAQKEIETKISKIEEIKSTTSTLTQSTLESYLVALNEINLEPTKIHGLKTSKFDDAKKSKELEIYNLAKSNKIETLSGKNVKDYLEDLKKSEKIIEDKKTLENIKNKLPTVPSENTTPKEFLAWYEDNEENFKTSKKYETSSDTEIKTLAKNILKKNTEFKKNYEAMKVNYITKISDININITDLTKYVENKKKLQTASGKLEKISGEIIEGITISDLTNFYKRATGEYIPTSSKNIFINLDEKLESTITRPNLNAVASKIKSKIIEVENAFDPKINISLDINNLTSIENYIIKYKEKENIISSFENEAIQKEKEAALEGEIKKIQKVYLNSINSSNDTIELEKIFSNYKTNVKEKISSTLGKIANLLSNDSVEKAYEEKRNELKIEEFGTKKVTELYEENSKYFEAYANFYEKYENYIRIKNDGPKLMQDSNLAIKQFLAMLEIYTTLPQNQLVDKDGEIISDTKFNGIEPAYDGFHKNAKDMIKEIKNNITNK